MTFKEHARHLAAEGLNLVTISTILSDKADKIIPETIIKEWIGDTMAKKSTETAPDASNSAPKPKKVNKAALVREALEKSKDIAEYLASHGVEMDKKTISVYKSKELKKKGKKKVKPSGPSVAPKEKAAVISVDLLGRVKDLLKEFGQEEILTAVDLLIGF